MKKISLPDDATLRQQINAHLALDTDELFRFRLNDGERERFAKHAPNFLAAFTSGDGSWSRIGAAASIDAERLYSAKVSNSGLSAAGSQTLDELLELRHLFARNAQRQAQVDALVSGHAATGSTPELWRDSEGRPVAVLRPGEPLAERTQSDVKFSDVVRAVALGRRVQEIQAAMSEGSVAAGAALVPSQIASSVIDRARALSVCQKAGQRTVKMPTAAFTIARVSGDPTLSWAAEAASLSDTAPTLAQVSLSAKTLRAWTKCSRELLEDAVNLDEVLRDVFAKAMAIELDRVSLFGSGSGAEPRGIAAASGAASGTAMGANGAALTSFDKLVDVWQALADANANVENLSMVMAPRTAATIGKFKGTDNQPLQLPPILANVRRFNTTSVPVNQTQGTATNASTIVGGDFSQLLLGVRSELQVIRSDSAFMQTNEIGLLFVLRADIAWTDASAFHRLYGIIP